MTRSSRPSFPPQILLRQSRARSPPPFSDLTFAPAENQFVVPPLGGRAGDISIPRYQRLPPKGGTTNRAFHLSRRHSFRRFLGKTEPILLLRVAHVGAPDNLLKVDLFIRERGVAEGGRLLTQTALE